MKVKKLTRYEVDIQREGEEYEAEEGRFVFWAEVEAAIAEAEAKAVPVWMPIETAPKDGTRILGFEPIENGIAIVHFAHRDRWYPSDEAERYDGCFSPSHWMPLPPAPSTSTQDK